MPEIRQTLSFLTISNRILERNFTYKVINSMNSLFKVAHITIKKNYFLANQIPVAKGDTISLSLQNNNEDKVTIFSGVIFDISTTNSEIQLKAEFRIVDNTIFNETYQDCTLEYALQKLLPSDKLKYEAQEVKGDQFILQGKKESSIRGLLKNHSYCLDRENCLVVFDKPKTRNNYIIDNCIKDIRGNQITIFPIPQLDLLDTVEYSNGIGELKKQKYLVRGLRVVGDYINMILDVAPYQEEIVKQNPPQEEAPLPASKPVKELFVSNKYRNGKLISVDELEKQINTNVWNAIKGTVEKIRNEMGDKFESIMINSAFRTGQEQVNAMVKLLELGWNLSIYYQDAKLSKPYLKIIQDRYDGKSNNNFESITQAYNASKYSDRNGAKRSEIFKDILDENPIVRGNQDSVKTVLEKSIATKHEIPNTNPLIKPWNEPLFIPSFHMLRDPETGHPSSYAMDIKRTNKNTEQRDSAHALYEDYKGKSRYDSTHYHLGS